jgi:hypothetical protein
MTKRRARGEAAFICARMAGASESTTAQMGSASVYPAGPWQKYGPSCVRLWQTERKA